MIDLLVWFVNSPHFTTAWNLLALFLVACVLVKLHEILKN